MFAQRKVGLGGIFHVEKITDEFSVAPDDEALAGQSGSDNAGDGPTEIEIASTKEIAATDDRGFEAIGRCVHLCDEIGAGFRDVIRVATL